MLHNKSNRIILYILFGLTFLTAAATLYLRFKDDVLPSAQAAPKLMLFPNIAQRFGDVKRVRITNPDGAFNFYRRDNVWQLSERDNYPISDERMNHFAQEVAALEIGNVVAQTPEEFDKYGVGEPVEFGFGTVLELFDAQDQLIAATHIGRKDGGLFSRKMGESITYSLNGRIEPFEKVADWLDYSVFKFSPEDVISSKVAVTGYRPYEVKRELDNSFSLNGKKNLGIEDIGEMSKIIKFIDVRPLKSIGSHVSATHELTLKSGDIVQMQLSENYKQHWLVLKQLSGSNPVLDDKAKSFAFGVDEKSAKIFANPAP